jgi:Tfp pilus assembly protein PilF
MAEDMMRPAPMPTASAGAFVGTFAMMVAAIAALLVFDLFVAGVDRRESRAHAANLYAEGLSLLAEHRPSDAEDRFTSAVAIDRASTRYVLALAEAKLDQGETSEAETTLRGLLERAENDGAVNLVMARTLLRSGHVAEATAYYHRAIFGRWGADSLLQRRNARFELIDRLAQRASQPELLAELLPLEDTSPDSVALRERLARLFVVAGSPARAITAFRDVLRRDPKNADAYAGMGDAEVDLGNFRAARADFAEALRLRPADTLFTERLAVIDSVFALDPSARGVGSAERLSRSRTLLERTLTTVIQCGDSAAPLIGVARGLLGQAVPNARRDVAVDSMVEIAGSLWNRRPPACGGTETALRLLHTRLARIKENM